MNLAFAHRLRVDPEQTTAHYGRHVAVFNRQGLMKRDADGYYFNQTRFLSGFDIRSGGKPVKPVSCANVEPHSIVGYYLLPSPAGRKAAPPGDPEPSGGEIVAKGIEIHINTFVGGGYHQDVEVTNRALAVATVRLDLLFAADFADIAEVSSGKRKQKAEVRRSFDPSGPGEGVLVFAYRHEKLNHATRIRISTPGTITDDGAAVSATLSLAPQEAQRISIDVAPVFLGEPSQPWFGLDGEKMAAKDVLARHEAWLSGCIEFEPSNQTVKSAWARAATDLWSLQALEGEGDAAFTPIGGIPKYTGLFGRDSLVVGVQSTFLNRATLNGSLLSVGEWTAKEVDNAHDAEPGKVLHQRQLSPLALLGTTPFLHYYGDYSAPAYYLIGAALHFADSGDAEAFEAVRDKVEATLAWMDRYGDIDGDGFYEYRTLAGKKGLKNQGWKDSEQAILYPDGSFVRDPIAVAEVQGLFYAAKQAVAAVFAALGDGERAKALLDQAAALKQRFNERYWMPDLKFYALALDPQKNQVKSIASNPALCLATGIVDDDKARHVVDRLMAPDMFSGWGVRTLSSEHPAFNPLAYHLGSVWPVSNAHACVGFKRYGFNDALHEVAKAMFDATTLFDFDRLPEVFGGYPRGDHWPYPGIYPDACSPQAWSASAIIQVCHMLTGVMILAPLRTLILDPALPEWLPEVAIRNLRIGDERVSIKLRREKNGETRHEVLEGGGGWRIVQPDLGGPGHDRFALALAEASRLAGADEAPC